MRNGKHPAKQTNPQNLALCASITSGEGMCNYSNSILCLAWWQCKSILKSIACCWPAMNRRSGHTERHWPLFLRELLEVAQYYVITGTVLTAFALFFQLGSNNCLCQSNESAGKREQSCCPPLTCQRASTWNSCVFLLWNQVRKQDKDTVAT